jgi:MFS transporter, PAT family, beta-lactamase induction signal transducer AmpG
MKNMLVSLRQLQDRRFLVVLLIGFASGFPWILHGSVLTLWMQSAGLTRSAIGLIGGVGAVYAIHWLWAPLIDRVRVPILSRYFGQRRSWLLLCQALLILLMLAMGQGDPSNSLGYIGICALGIASVSATQDIAIDSYRVLLFRADEADAKLPFASALATTGWWAGYGFVGGALALTLGGESIGLSWPAVYQCMALLTVVVMLLLVALPEVELENQTLLATEVTTASQPRRASTLAMSSSLKQLVIAPFVEFFQRCGLKLGLAILIFLFSFRLGEAMLGRMSLVFYVELGFTTEEIALYQKFLGGLFTVVCSLLGALINTRYGVMRGMLVGGIAMAVANLLYALMAAVGPQAWLFVLTLLIDNFCNAFATVTVISFISYFTSRTFTGTQFALMTSLSNFGRTTLAAGSGMIIDALDGNWSLFFVLTTLAVIPALCLLVWVGKLLEGYRATQ